MKNTKEIIICLIVVTMLILTIAVNVFAVDTNNVLDINQELGNEVGYNNILGNETPTTKSPKNDLPLDNTKANTEKIPKTGVDYSVILIMGVCIIVTIYAYKKIRDYRDYNV